jgi:hypothetical protein
VKNTDFLQAVTLLTTRKRNRESALERSPAISAKRDDILRLGLNDYLRWVDPLAAAFEWAAVFLADQHIFDVRFVPYATQLVPLAVMRVILGEEADHHAVRERISRWFWCGILGEQYGSATESRFARDIDQVPGWVRDPTAPQPTTVTESVFQEARLFTLRTRLSAAYKGIYALLIATGAQDWIKGVTFGKVQYAELRTDIHHIFPEQWCHSQGIPRERYDTIINKTPLAAETNRSIGGVAPTTYLRRVEQKSGYDPARVDEVIATHGIDVVALRSDDFDAHIEARKQFLIDLIERATGNKVHRAELDLDVAALAAQYEAEDSDNEPDVLEPTPPSWP